MTDSTVVAVPAVPVAPKSPKKKVAAAKSKASVATHPSTAIMVTVAIKELKEKKGSTLQAIKKYLAANYKVDSAKLAPFIRKFLKASVTQGSLVQTNGSGALGHFKLATELKKPAKKVAKKSLTVKAPGATKKRKLAPKKPKSSEPAAKKAKKAVAVPKPKATKSPAKTKKAPATKGKPPKAKKSPVKKVTVTKKK